MPADAAGGQAAGRFAALDGLRGLAALNVILNHAVVAFDFAIYTGQAEHAHGGWEAGLSAWPLLLPVAGANFSVCLFFVLSGFVLAHAFSATRLGIAALAVKRLLRLGLPILVVTLFAWALHAAGLIVNQVAAPLTRSPWLASQFRQEASLAGALAEGLYGSLVGPWDFATSYDSALWTMSIEFAGSLMLIAAIVALRPAGGARASPRLAAAILLLLGLALYPLYLSLLVLGACLFVLLPRLRPGMAPWACLGLAALALLLGTVPYSAARGAFWDGLAAIPVKGLGLPWHWIGPGAMRMDGVSACHGIAAVMLVLAVACSPWLEQRLSGRGMRRLGTISFPLYLVHIPVLMSVGCGTFLAAEAAGLPYGAAVALAVPAYAAVALGLAALAVWLVERPAIRIAGWGGRMVQAGMERLRRAIRPAALRR